MSIGVSNLSRLGSATISRSNSLRSNSLPRDIRTPRTPLSSLNTRCANCYIIQKIIIRKHFILFSIFFLQYYIILILIKVYKNL